MADQFSGKKEKWFPFFWDWEQRWISKAVPRLPHYLNGTNLTWFTIPICLLVILFYWLATYNIQWLWAVSVVIILQYITDSLDGAVGRFRHSGLEKWGYYMDHLVDYLFLCSIIIGFAILLPEHTLLLMLFLALLGGFYVSSYLAANVTTEFRMSYFKIGPTEERIFVIILNIIIIFFGSLFISYLLPILIIILFILLSSVIYITQKSISNSNNQAPKQTKT